MATYEDTLLRLNLAPEVFQRSPDAVIIVDVDGEIRIANEQASILTGYTESELLHQPVDALLPETLRDGHESHRAAYVREPRTRIMGEGRSLELRHKDGSLVPVEINLAPLTHDLGIFTIATIRRRRGE